MYVSLGYYHLILRILILLDSLRIIYSATDIACTYMCRRKEREKCTDKKLAHLI